VLHATGGLVMIGYGAVLFRRRPVMVGSEEQRPVGPGRGELRRGVALGLATTLLNPSALVTWVVIVGAHATDITRAQAAAWVSGIVVGAFAWFLVVVFLALRGRRALRGKAAWLTYATGVVLVATGLFSLARAFGVV
jgi:arginine exporter protein ArgO